MQHLEVSGALRPLKWSLGVKWLIMKLFGNHEPNNLIAFTDDLRFCIQLVRPQTKDRSSEMPSALSLSH